MKRWLITILTAMLAWLEAPQEIVRQVTTPDDLVAVLDTGFDLEHEWIKPCVYKVIDLTDGDGTDTHGHGTGTASAICKDTDFQAKLILIKITKGKSVYSDVARDAFKRAANEGAKYINYSFGGKSFNRLTQEGVDFAVDKGSEVYKSAGNSGDRMTYPCSNVLPIGAVNERRQRATFSSYIAPRGCVGVYAVQVGLGAVVAKIGGGTKKVNGTSFAAPKALAAAWIGKRYEDDNLVNECIKLGYSKQKVGCGFYTVLKSES